MATHCFDLQDSGRISPNVTPTMKASLHTSQGTLDVCDISADDNDVLQKLASAIKVLQQSFEEQHLLDALNILKFTLEDENDDCIIYLQSNQVHLQVIAVLNHLPESLEVQRTGLQVLHLLCERTNMLESMLNSGVSGVLLHRLKNFRGDQYVQQYCLSVIAQLFTSELYRLHIRQDDHLLDIWTCVGHAIISFSEIPEVLRAASRVIANCIHTEVSTVEKTRDYFMKHVGCHIVDSLKSGVELSSQLHLLVLLVNQHSDDHRNALIENDFHITLMELCSKYPSDTVIMPAATDLLAFVNQNETVQQIMTANNFVQNGLFAVMDVLRVSGHVQKSGLKMIETLDVVRYQSFVEQIPEKIIACMRQFPKELMIQEAGLEAFAVLAGAEGGSDMLLNRGALDATMETMNKSLDNVLIVKKGLIVLQLFASPAMANDETTRQMIVTIIYTALKNFTDLKGVQTEACVAIQLLAEADSSMSTSFVDTECHQCLFELLENDDAPGLQELASECLYVLSQEQNLKSDMLLSACRKGMLPATECLIELGADVNVGTNKHTPLYLAVNNQHENIVKLLLRQEVQDLRTPLRRSLELETHVTTGLILQQLGYDRENGIVCWTGQGLEALHSMWLITTLSNRLSASLDTDIGRVYIKQIKHGEQRRRRRKLAYSKSDSSLRYPHVRLRHQIVYEQRPDMHISKSTPTSKLHRGSVIPGSPANTKKIFPRSKSFDEASMLVRNSRIPTLPTIMASSPSGNEEVVFDMSPTEEEEWRETTLSGANPSYSQNDPRLRPSPTNMRKNGAESGLWRRKASRTSKGSVSSDEESKSSSPLLHLRKMSAPVLSELELLKVNRPLSAELITNAETTVMNRPLVILDATENHIEDIGALLSADLKSHLANLDKLDLRCNRIKLIAEDIYKNLPSLQIFDLSSNEIEIYPQCLFRCHKLKELRLGANCIKDIGPTEDNAQQTKTCCASLRVLDLSRNEIKSLPDDVGSHFPGLEELLLSQNDLMELPNKSLNLPDLQVLDLARNDIDTLPDKFLQICSKLETIDLSYNKLSKLPHESYAAQLPLLIKVKLRQNHLVEKSPFYIPRFLLELPSLRTIDISENGLMGLPTLSMWKTKTMKDFFASKNKIQYLCLKDAKHWSKLEKLHLAHNNLSELPREIGTFTTLHSLDISYNTNITTLPDELGKCSKIYEMSITGLDLDLNRSVLQRRVKDIISYLRNRLTRAQRYYRMKLMVVGYGGRGKTTLLNTLMKEKQKKKENRPTVGVVVKNWVYPTMERRDSEDSNRWYFGSGRKTERVEYTLNTWDFAGQEEFYSTHNCYLSNRAVYLVVFDLNRGVSECEILKSWLFSIRSRAPGCPVIVVGTHLDKVPHDGRGDREIRKITEMLRDFNIKPGFPTISKVLLVNAAVDDENMEDLRASVKETVNGFEIRGRRVMGEKIPASYVQLADVLTSKVESEFPVLNHKELLELVESNGINLDEDELNQAIRFLHECGVLLHYDDSSLQLKDYYFIDPGWLCRMMAQVITVRQINPFINPDGILRKRDIDVLFKDSSKFPKALIPQYIKLLEKFEIALPHTDNELLIPCRLPKHRPHIQTPIHEKIKRMYRMPFVPIGLWFRLIARMISLFSHEGFNTVNKNAKVERQIYWTKGMYVFWNEGKYFFLDSHLERETQMESILIMVPSSCQGMRLLGQIVDGLDNLIDEWYPGLTSIDPMMGQEILEVLAPCTQCQGSVPYMYKIVDLQKIASKQDFIKCPQHDGDVLLTELAPDLVLGDMEFEMKLDKNVFKFEESSANQLGDGGFGEVYRAEYKGQVVAAKLFKEIADVHPLKMLRQEVTVLRCLNHPSVVSLMAVGIRPPMIVIEYAQHDTLAALCKSNDISNKKHIRLLKHRIALQVAEGLMYLRSIMIVFRDMKPENVLIFNTSLDSPINAKIADYGIARFTTMQGLRAQEGTPGFRAPEVIRKENYSFQADIFSYGLTLYMMLSGRHPFHYMESRGEIDRAIAEGRRIPPPETLSSSILPDMKQITMACLQYEPDKRPTAEVVWQLLGKPEVNGLQRKIPVSRSTTVECQAIEQTRHGGKMYMRLWIASGDSESFQLSYMDLNDGSSKTKGLLFSYGRILCMQSLGGHRMAIGTQLGKLWLFDTIKCKILHSTMQLDDSVLCMNYYRKADKDGGDVLLVGLANGRIAIFTVQELLHEANTDPVCLYPGCEYEPVLCMARQGFRVYVSCGAQLVVLNTEKGIMIEKIIPTSISRDPSVPPIYTLAVVKGQIIFSKKSSTTIEIWDVHKDKLQKSFQVEDLFGIPKADARVTALSADNKSLWVGTHGGYIAVVEIKTLAVLAVTRRYTRAVRSLEHVRFAGDLQHKTVFSGGLGYMDICGTDAQKDFVNTGPKQGYVK